MNADHMTDDEFERLIEARDARLEAWEELAPAQREQAWEEIEAAG